MNGQGVVEFDRFRLDPATRLLVDTRTGDPIPLPPRVFDTLLCLVEHSGELVTKSDLMDRVWPGVTVEENSLTQNISQLRRALGDNGNDRRFIVTAPGKGYRFVEELQLAQATSSPSPASSEAPARPVPAMRTSLAVLSFTNLTGDPSQDYLGEGMAEEIIDLLSSCTGLRLPGRGAMLNGLRDTPEARVLTKQIGVDAILEGSVRASAERLRISAKLVDGRDGYLLWSRSFDRPRDDILKIQAEVAAEVVDALAENLNPSIVRSTFKREPVLDVEAYHTLLKAFWVRGEGSVESHKAAIEMLDRVIERLPNFARGYAEKALCIAALNSARDLPIDEMLDEAEAMARRALEIDPKCYEAYSALGQLATIHGDWLAAEMYLSRVRTATPNQPWAAIVMSSMLTQTMGHLDAGFREMTEFEAFIPFQSFTAMALGLGAVLAGYDQRAEEYCRMGLATGFTPSAQPHAEMRALLDTRKGQFDSAAESVISAMLPAERTAYAGTVRLVYQAIGGKADRDEALAALAQVHAAGVSDLELMIRKRLVLWYTQLGDVDLSARVLREIVADMNAKGFGLANWSFLWLHELRPLHRHPDFIAIAHEIGMTAYWETHGPPDGYLYDGERLIPRNE